MYTADKIRNVLEALADYQEQDFENNLGSELGPTIIKIPAKQLHIIAVGVFNNQSYDTHPKFLDRFLDVEPIQNSIKPQAFFQSIPDTSEGLIFAKGQRYYCFGIINIPCSRDNTQD